MPSRSDRPASPKTRRALVLLGPAALLLAGGLSGCGERQPVRIGFLGGMSGRVADLGIGGRNGAQLAVEDLNAAGGVLGRTVELLSRDDEHNDLVARRRLAELFDSGVGLVVGPMTSSVAMAVAPLAGQRGVALISPTSTTHELSGLADAFFRVVSDAPAGARQQADMLLVRGARRLVTVTDLKNRAFAQSWTAAAAQRFSAGGGALTRAIEFEAAPGLQFTELARRVADAKGDAVVIAASAADSSVLVQQLRRIDPNPLVSLSPWGGTEQLLELGGRALDGVLVMQYFDRNSTTPAYLGFVERYHKRFGEPPGYPSVNAYDALMLGVAAMRDAGSAEPAALLAALRRLREHTGLQRPIALDAFGDSGAPIFVNEIREGRYVPASR